MNDDNDVWIIWPQKAKTLSFFHVVGQLSLCQIVPENAFVDSVPEKISQRSIKCVCKIVQVQEKIS